MNLVSVLPQISTEVEDIVFYGAAIKAAFGLHAYVISSRSSSKAFLTEVAESCTACSEESPQYEHARTKLLAKKTGLNGIWDLTPACRAWLTKIFHLIMDENHQDQSQEAIADRVNGYKVLAGATGENSAAADTWSKEPKSLEGFLAMHRELIEETIDEGPQSQTMSVLLNSQIDWTINPSSFLIGSPAFLHPTSRHFEEQDNNFEDGDRSSEDCYGLPEGGFTDEGPVIVLDEAIVEFLADSYEQICENYTSHPAESKEELRRWMRLFNPSPSEENNATIPKTPEEFVNRCTRYEDVNYFEVYSALVKVGFPPFQARTDEVIKNVWDFNLRSPWWTVAPRALQMMKTRSVASWCGPETVAEKYFKRDFVANTKEENEKKHKQGAAKRATPGFYRFLRFSAVLGLVVASGPFSISTTSAMLAASL